MMLRALTLLLALPLQALLAPAQEAPPPPPTVLVGATVHSMLPGAEPAVASILIDGDRIVAVGPDIEAPPESTRIDVEGLHVIPGLLDAAVNHDVEHDALYISSGVTLVRDTGNLLGTVLNERVRENRDRVPGPALLAAGQILDSTLGATTDALVLVDAGDARDKLARLFTLLETRARESALAPDALHLDFLSFHNGLAPDAYVEVLRIAHEVLGIEVWGPVPAALKLGEAVAAGQDGLFGLHALLPAGKSWDTVTLADLEGALDLLGASEVKLTPILGTLVRTVADRSGADRDLRLLGPLYEQAWLDQAQTWDEQPADGALQKRTELALAMQRLVLHELWERGVTLVPGSGAPHPWLFPGRSLLEELEQWVLAGIPREEVLRLATSGAAEALGVADERGSIAPGRFADLAVLGTDPRRSLSGLADPELVVVRGRVLERDELFDLLEATREHQSKVRAMLGAELEIEPPLTPPGETVLQGSAETHAHGRRIRGERFAVVECLDGRTAYCARVVIPQAMDVPEHELHLVQWFRGNRLESFELVSTPLVPEELRDKAVRLEVQGALVGDTSRMTIQRRSQFGFHDNRVADDPLSLIDLSDSLTALIVGRHLPEGVSFVLNFEGGGLDPVADRWELWIDDQKRVQVRGTQGAIAAAFSPDGVPYWVARRVGSGRTDLVMGATEGRLPIDARRVHEAPREEGASDDGNAGSEDDGGERP